jgi:DnaJ-class molecular chaperone
MSVREITCPVCGGSRYVKCPDCDGQGGEEKTYGGETKWYPCPYCNGTGRKICSNCNGWGTVKVYE